MSLSSSIGIGIILFGLAVSLVEYLVKREGPWDVWFGRIRTLSFVTGAAFGVYGLLTSERLSALVSDLVQEQRAMERQLRTAQAQADALSSDIGTLEGDLRQSRAEVEEAGHSIDSLVAVVGRSDAALDGLRIGVRERMASIASASAEANRALQSEVESRIPVIEAVVVVAVDVVDSWPASPSNWGRFGIGGAAFPWPTEVGISSAVREGEVLLGFERSLETVRFCAADFAPGLPWALADVDGALTDVVSALGDELAREMGPLPLEEDPQMVAVRMIPCDVASADAVARVTGADAVLRGGSALYVRHARPEVYPEIYAASDGSLELYTRQYPRQMTSWMLNPAFVRDLRAGVVVRRGASTVAVSFGLNLVEEHSNLLAQALKAETVRPDPSDVGAPLADFARPQPSTKYFGMVDVRYNAELVVVGHDIESFLAVEELPLSPYESARGFPDWEERPCGSVPGLEEVASFARIVKGLLGEDVEAPTREDLAEECRVAFSEDATTYSVPVWTVRMLPTGPSRPVTPRTFEWLYPDGWPSEYNNGTFYSNPDELGGVE